LDHIRRLMDEELLWEMRAARADFSAFEAVLAKVPDIEPIPEDRLSVSGAKKNGGPGATRLARPISTLSTPLPNSVDRV
ncbi:hypothetical protein, partial [Methylomagnum sp.]